MMTSTGSLMDPGTATDVVCPLLLSDPTGCVLDIFDACPAGELLLIGCPAAASPFIIHS